MLYEIFFLFHFLDMIHWELKIITQKIVPVSLIRYAIYQYFDLPSQFFTTKIYLKLHFYIPTSENVVISFDISDFSVVSH